MVQPQEALALKEGMQVRLRPLFEVEEKKSLMSLGWVGKQSIVMGRNTLLALKQKRCYSCLYPILAFVTIVVALDFLGIVDTGS